MSLFDKEKIRSFIYRLELGYLQFFSISNNGINTVNAAVGLFNRKSLRTFEKKGQEPSVYLSEHHKTLVSSDNIKKSHVIGLALIKTQILLLTSNIVAQQI